MLNLIEYFLPRNFTGSKQRYNFHHLVASCMIVVWFMEVFRAHNSFVFFGCDL